MYKLNTINQDILKAAKAPGNSLELELRKYVRVDFYQINGTNGKEDIDAIKRESVNCSQMFDPTFISRHRKTKTLVWDLIKEFKCPNTQNINLQGRKSGLLDE